MSLDGTRPYPTTPSPAPPPRPTTEKPLDGTNAPKSSPAGDGTSGGTVAGIVIGVLLLVGLAGGIAFVVVTGRTHLVLTSVRSAGSRVKSSATSRMRASGVGGFSNSNYDSDRSKVIADPEYHREESDSYT